MKKKKPPKSPKCSISTHTIKPLIFYSSAAHTETQSLMNMDYMWLQNPDPFTSNNFLPFNKFTPEVDINAIS